MADDVRDDVADGVSGKGDQIRPRVTAEGLIAAAMGVSLVLALATAAIGLNMALDRRDSPCPDGTRFPDGASDFTCSVHPQGTIGVVITLFSVMFATVIVFSGVAAAATVRDQRQPSREQER